MPEKYTKEQLWELYQKLPPELQEAIFSEETANNIYSVCEKNGIVDDKIPKIAKLTGDILLGLLPPEDFQASLELDLDLKSDLAKKISQEIHRFVFYPVRTKLSELYRKEIPTPAGEPSELEPEEKLEKELAKEKLIKEKERMRAGRKTPEKEDIYREPAGEK